MARLVQLHDPYAAGRGKARRPPHFHTLVQSIINQQLSVKAARTISARLRLGQGGGHFNAERLLALRPSAMRDCGISSNKVHFIRTLARAMRDSELNFLSLARADDDTVRQVLTQYPGIGHWSADMFLMFGLHRPDVLPLGDLALRKSMQRIYRLADNAGEEAYLAIADPWRPYRTVASRYLWAALG
jgi:DNA-3-methyladenine glycosylase II